MLDKVKVLALVGAIFAILRLVLDVEIPPELVRSVEAIAIAVLTLISVATAYVTPERQKNVNKLKTR